MNIKKEVVQVVWPKYVWYRQRGMMAAKDLDKRMPMDQQRDEHKDGPKTDYRTTNDDYRKDISMPSEKVSSTVVVWLQCSVY